MRRSDAAIPDADPEFNPEFNPEFKSETGVRFPAENCWAKMEEIVESIWSPTTVEVEVEDPEAIPDMTSPPDIEPSCSALISCSRRKAAFSLLFRMTILRVTGIDKHLFKTLEVYSSVQMFAKEDGEYSLHLTFETSFKSTSSDARDCSTGCSNETERLDMEEELTSKLKVGSDESNGDNFLIQDPKTTFKRTCCLRNTKICGT